MNLFLPSQKSQVLVWVLLPKILSLINKVASCLEAGAAAFHQQQLQAFRGCRVLAGLQGFMYPVRQLPSTCSEFHEAPPTSQQPQGLHVCQDRRLETPNRWDRTDTAAKGRLYVQFNNRNTQDHVKQVNWEGGGTCCFRCLLAESPFFGLLSSSWRTGWDRKPSSRWHCSSTTSRQTGSTDTQADQQTDRQVETPDRQSDSSPVEAVFSLSTRHCKWHLLCSDKLTCWENRRGVTKHQHSAVNRSCRRRRLVTCWNVSSPSDDPAFIFST